MTKTLWTDEERESLRNLCAQPLTWAQRGRKLGRSGNAVRNQARRLGIEAVAPRVGVEGTEEAPTADSASDNERISRDERHNTITAESKSPRIKTLEQLLEACEVDLNVWRVERYIVNKWEVGAKEEHTDLAFDNGVMTGAVKKEGLLVHPLFQVKAWLVRIEPEPIFPALQPVASNITVCDSPEPIRRNIRRSLIWADPHFGFTRDLRTGHLTPFHDRRTLDVILQIAQVAQPDRIDCLGDLLDLPEWTDKFLRSPEFYHTTQPAVLEAHWWLAQLRLTAPNAAIAVHEGNHDRRLDDAIVKHLRAAYDLRAADELDLPPAFSVPKLLALHQLGIRWVDDYPNDEDWLNDGVRLAHGDKAQVQGNTAKAVVNSADVTEIFGHIHRIEWVSRTQYRRDGQSIIAGFCPGCTCYIDGRVPGKTSQQQWQNGCAIVDYEADGSLYAIHPIVIDDGRAVWDGQLFVAQDRLDEIRDAWPEWEWCNER